jgi:hypothetical protein
MGSRSSQWCDIPGRQGRIGAVDTCEAYYCGRQGRRARPRPATRRCSAGLGSVKSTKRYRVRCGKARLSVGVNKTTKGRVGSAPTRHGHAAGRDLPQRRGVKPTSRPTEQPLRLSPGCKRRKPRHVRGFKWMDGGNVQRNKSSRQPDDSPKREARKSKKIERRGYSL